MEPLVVGYIGIAVLLLLLFCRIPSGAVMGIVGVLGLIYMLGWDAAIVQIGMIPYSSLASYDYIVIPLFIVMGTFCFYAGLSEELYDTAYKWVGHLPGGLAMATIAACAGFAAVSGSSLATGATMGTVALPQMKRYRYDPALATGCIAAGGCIGILIPPSIIMVIYGILTEQSIGKLFIGGFLPGILETLIYIIGIYIVCVRNPIMGPRAAPTSFIEKLASLKSPWAILILFLLVIGGIYAGIFSATEAAGIGAFGALVIGLGKRKLNWRNFVASLKESAEISVMTFFILVGAQLFFNFLVVTRLPNELAGLITGLGLNRYIIMIFIVIIYVILGCFVGALSMVIVTVPIFFPIIYALGFDPIWFGIIIVIMVEVGGITPPYGINVFVIKGIAKDVPLGTIFRGTMPFLWGDFALVALLLAFPQIVLVLPNLMR